MSAIIVEYTVQVEFDEDELAALSEEERSKKLNGLLSELEESVAKIGESVHDSYWDWP